MPAYHLSTEEKYKLYESAVQNPRYDVTFFHRQYEKFYQKTPTILREDFGGTGLISSHWVKKSPKHKAYAVDLDLEPINYGKATHQKKLKEGERQRLVYLQQDVLKSESVKAHVIAALNFSYFIFKERELLKQYFISAKRSLMREGFFVLDIFGGTACHTPLEECTEHENFNYYWDCDQFNPITNECLYKIHFKRKGERQRINDVFVYDWRHWTIPEICDILKDSGFSDVSVYWEGDDNEGGGNGIFKKAKRSDNCESWISYIIARP